jgi:alpha-1,2-mannosyltransferase
LPLLLLAAALVVTVAPMFGERELRSDFAAYYYAARVERQLGDIYDETQLNVVASSDGPHHHIFPYLYPPLLCKLMSPFALLPPLSAQATWLGFNVASFVLLMVVLTRFSMLVSGLPSCSWRLGSAIAACAALVLYFALRRDLRMGQVNIVLTVLIAGGLYLAERGRAAGGPLLGLAAVLKVLPGALALLLLARNKMRPLVVMVASTAAMGAVLIATMGREVLSFLAMGARMGYGKRISFGFTPDFFNNYSFGGFFCRFFGVGSPLVAPASIACILVLFALGVVYKKELADSRNLPQGLTYATCLMFVPSPVVWLHHLVYLLPAACAAVAHVVAPPSAVQRRGAAVLLVLMAAASLPYESVYLRAYGEEPTWQMSIFIPNLLLIVALMLASIKTARATSLAAPEAPALA